MKEALIENVNKWTRYADEDLKLAEHSLLLESSCPYRLTAYHAQQCAEKYLKALLVFHKIDFPYTHSISRLLELAGAIIRLDEYKDAETLTPYAITTRYPGEDEDVTKDEALQTIGIAKSVKERIIKLLPYFRCHIL